MAVTDVTIVVTTISDSCDFRNAQNANWDTLHDSPSEGVYAGASVYYVTNRIGAGIYWNCRWRLSWDKTAFDAAGVSFLTKATVRLRVYLISQNLGGKTIFLVNGGTLDASNALQADYGALKSSLTIYGSTLISNLVEGTYWEIELPQAGLDELNEQLAAGDAKIRLGVRGSLDYTDTAPIDGVSELLVQFNGDSSLYPPEIVVNGTTAPVSPPGGSSTEDQIRVTSLRHVYRPGAFKLEMGLGGLSSALEIPEYEGFKSKLPEPPPSPIRPSGWYWTEFPEVPEPPRKDKVRMIALIPGVWLREETRGELLKALREEGIGGVVSSAWRETTPWAEERGETFFDWLKGVWRGIFRR